MLMEYQLMPFSVYKVFLLIACLAHFISCAPTQKTSQIEQQHPQAVSLMQAPDKLAQKLISSTGRRESGRVGVLGLTGPDSNITKFGEYLSDKLSGALYQSGAFQSFVERRQLRRVQLAHGKEFGIRFDQKTVEEFGQTLGTDSLVIGTIRDLGQVYDVTAKIVSSAKGEILGQAGIVIKKNSDAESLAGKTMRGSLTISVSPPVEGTVLAGGQKARLRDGTASFSQISYGDCLVRIQAEGFKPEQRHISVRRDSVSFHADLESREHKVTFQVTPPDAGLHMEGEEVELDQQGYGTMKGLVSKEYTYSVSAEGYKRKAGTFNPASKSIVTLELSAEDAYYSTRKKFFQIARKMRQQRDFEVKVWTDRGTYQTGETIRFHVRSEKDCYLNLVNINSRGEVTLLFPNRFDQDNRIRGGKTYTIPGKDYGFSLKVQPPRGTDRVFALAGGAYSTEDGHPVHAKVASKSTG